MEFLQTPDLGGNTWSSNVSSRGLQTGVTPAIPGASPTFPQPGPGASSAGLPSLTPATLNSFPNATPKGLFSSTPFINQLDRTGIKNSFQSLFSPSPGSNVAATPALLSRTTAPGLTPFLNATQTPGLVPPCSALLPTFSSFPLQKGVSASPNVSEQGQKTPYLTAAAKEAVRREFMSMPSYVATLPPPEARPQASTERQVPEKVASPKYSVQVVVQTGAQVPASGPQSSTTQLTQQRNEPHEGSLTGPSSPSDAKVPDNSPKGLVHKETKSSCQESGEKTTSTHPDSQQPHQQTHAIPPQMHPYFIPQTQPVPGMVMFGQHAPVMMAPPPGMFPHPGMVMFPGGQPMVPPHGMLMHPPQSVMPQRVVPPKSETPEERKARVENEKQDLIREFKKKTREAALVRFRQKRRERRFGKLIRYDCRKKLADARPRVKGRFVRMKNENDDESEPAQVVPNMQT
ncbi:Two-component response regulator-like PRR37 [Gracilariopsis chorda]|uniref:Two-component response regulator-like PRR37 n=1 Tax=Gracilariopsis chorda TaxID=448386 RepID=A0A2V3J4Q5_9FLOR|nr:Two-component response regulator-like PRR37 [Gracilariopsis chorda]|eukprot:PXF49408.1 Two-component response regulator-like PRR37 [Gracilariopsis chorda]